MNAALVLIVFSLAGAPADPQQADVPTPAIFEISAGLEYRFDRFRYRFENPSTFDTVELVEHFFQQRYDAHHNWLVARASDRRPQRLAWSMEAGFTPEIVTFGEDLDTFFNPGNNVIVSGTTGRVHMQSFRAGAGVERERPSGTTQRLRYSFRRDRSNFLLDQLKIVTTSNPPSRVETIIPSSETTISHVHQFWIGWRSTRPVSPQWRVIGDLDVSPGTLARLSTRLPVKYPGQDIVFWAGGFELAGRVTLARRGRWPVAVSVDAGRTFSYRTPARFIRDALGVSITAGLAR